MAQNDPYDDGPNIVDLIKSTEESSSFEDFLITKSSQADAKGATQCASQNTASDAGVSSSASSGEQGETGRLSDSSVQPVIAASPQRLTQKEKLELFLKNQKPTPRPVPPPPPESLTPPTPVLPSPEDLPTKVVPSAITDFTEITHVHNHPIVGMYTSTEQVAVEIDDEISSIQLNIFNECISGMSWEQVQDTIHRCRRDVVRTNAKIQGLNKALEYFIGRMNMAEKGLLLERDRAYRSPKREKKSSSSAAGTKEKKASLKPSNEDEKTLVMLHKMGMDKTTVLERTKKQGKYSEANAAFIERLYGFIS